MELAWQAPKSSPIAAALIFSKDLVTLVLEVGLLVTYSTFSESVYAYDHILNFSREHLLKLIHFQIKLCCESGAIGCHLWRGKRCIRLLSPLVPNKVNFTSRAGDSFGASRTWAGTCSLHSTSPQAVGLSKHTLAAQADQSHEHHKPDLQPWAQQAQLCLPLGPVSINA